MVRHQKHAEAAEESFAGDNREQHSDNKGPAD